MNHLPLRPLFWSFLSAAVLVQCTSYPITKQYRKEADIGLTVPQVQKNPDSYKGKTVIWGGIILSVINDSSGSRLTVMESPLQPDGFPMPSSASRGRFIGNTTAFLDPVIYYKGRPVTIAGTIEGVTMMKLGEGSYAYPVLMIKQMRYWQKVFYYPSFFYDPFYYPRWHRHSRWPYYYDNDFMMNDMFEEQYIPEGKYMSDTNKTKK